MAKPFYKHKILLDENMDPRQRYPHLNQHFDLKHIKHDLHCEGIEDPDVYKVAVELGRIIITLNAEDFRPLVGTKPDAGVIKIPSAWTCEQVDTKLTSLLKRHGPAYFTSKYRTLATE